MIRKYTYVNFVNMPNLFGILNFNYTRKINWFLTNHIISHLIKILIF